MKKKTIKFRLAKYSIHQKRSTTINHAFASAIAPCDLYDEDRVVEALRFLGQDPDGDLTCVYCGRPARTWDHLVALVKDRELHGFGHQLGNLVPSCKDCNSSKGSKDFALFINGFKGISGDRALLLERLVQYLARFAKPIDMQRLKNRLPEKLKRYGEIKIEIRQLLMEADEIADLLRREIVE